MPTYKNDNGTWREVKDLYVKDSGTWREVKEGYVNDNGTWRLIHQALFPKINSTNMKLGGNPGTLAGVILGGGGAFYTFGNMGTNYLLKSGTVTFGNTTDFRNDNNPVKGFSNQVYVNGDSISQPNPVPGPMPKQTQPKTTIGSINSTSTTTANVGSISYQNLLPVNNGVSANITQLYLYDTLVNGPNNNTVTKITLDQDSQNLAIWPANHITWIINGRRYSSKWGSNQGGSSTGNVDSGGTPVYKGFNADSAYTDEGTGNFAGISPSPGTPWNLMSSGSTYSFELHNRVYFTLKNETAARQLYSITWQTSNNKISLNMEGSSTQGTGVASDGWTAVVINGITFNKSEFTATENGFYGMTNFSLTNAYPSNIVTALGDVGDTVSFQLLTE
jgi:hypothetical protein